MTDLSQLSLAYLEGSLTPEQQNELQQRLTIAADRDEFALYCFLDHEIREAHSHLPFQDAMADAIRFDTQITSAAVANSAPRPAHRETWFSKYIPRDSVVITAVLFLAVGVILGHFYLSDDARKNADRTKDKKPAVAKYVAILNHQYNAVWLEGRPVSANDPRLKIGRRLVIESGLIEVKYYTGAVVVIEGPAEFYVGGKKAEGSSRPPKPMDQKKEGNSGYLANGKLVARVEGQDAKGFVVDTPSGLVEDLGTEFAVEVGGGDAAVAVTEGSVEIQTAGAGGSVVRTRLFKDEAALVSGVGERAVVKSIEARALIAFAHEHRKPMPTQGTLAVVAADASDGDQQRFASTVLADDLVNKDAPSLDRIAVSDYVPFRGAQSPDSPVYVLNNGMHGGNTDDHTIAGSAFDKDGKFRVVYYFNTADAPEGYDLIQIRTYAAHGDNRAGQSFVVSVDYVGGDERFVLLGRFESPTPGGLDQASRLTLAHPNLNDALPFASGVAAIRFDFRLPPVGEATVWREIDISGTKTTAGAAPVEEKTTSQLQTPTQGVTR